MTLKNLFVSLRNVGIHLRIYLGRGVTYLSIANAGMILFLFLSKLKEVGIINIELDSYFIPLVFLCFLILIFIGWFEIKFMRGVQYENSVVFNLTPQMADMKEKIDLIYQKMEVEQRK